MTTRTLAAIAAALGTLGFAQITPTPGPMMAMMGGAGQPTVMSSGGMAGMQTMHAMTGPS
jgi:hypothetical protein